MKRVRPAPMGRAFRIVKRTTHLTVQVTERPQVIKAVGADEASKAPKSARAPKAKGSKRSKEAAAKA
jgi:large subunit ribosomal protein L22